MKKKVLITDDDPAMQDALRLIFERAGYHTTVLGSATSLMDGTAELPDIYVLDKQLSGIDGLDVCRFLKGQPRTGHIPVVMVSASPNIANLAKDVRADDYLEKPFRQADLLGIVKKLLDGEAT